MLAQAIELIKRGDYPRAIGLLQQTVIAQPKNFEARIQLAKAYLDWVNIQAKMPLTDIAPAMLDEGIVHYLRLAESQLLALAKTHPSSPHVQTLLGVVHLVYKRPAEAEACLKKALGKDPLNPDLIYNMGFSLMEQERYGEAEKLFVRLVKLHSGHGMGWHMLGEAIRLGGNLEASLKAYRQAIKLLPDWPQPYGGMGSALLALGRHDEWLPHMERALALDPDVLLNHTNLLFRMHYHPGLSAAQLAARHLASGEHFEARLKPQWRTHGNLADPERKLRVGFVSSDFGAHPVGYFMTDLLASLKTADLELFAYSSSKHDEVTGRIKLQFGAWRECRTMSDDALADQIRADGIDILVDLGGHTQGNRLLAFARKPAPVQVTYLGYPDTTGLTAVDYILGDSLMFPPGEESLYAETPWRLPDTSLCFTPPDLPVEVGPLPAGQIGCTTFGCLNKAEKINNDAVIRTWARVLHAVPGSRLLLQNKLYDVEDIARQVRRGFSASGIEGDRLELIGKLSWRGHMETYNRIDIALDPFPYNGTTTSIEGLWMGVPLLALKGDRLVAHMGESILHTMGMPEWIAESEDDYVAKAASFAGDLAGLSTLRASLRERLLTSPICDAPGFARKLEEAFRGMWRQWCEKRDA